MILFVDDSKERWRLFAKRFPDLTAKDVVFSSTVDDAILSLLTYGSEIDTVWLDHDAGEAIIDGKRVDLNFRSVAVALALMSFKGHVYLHSSNQEGRDWMEKIFNWECKWATVHNETSADVRFLWGAEDKPSE